MKNRFKLTPDLISKELKVIRGGFPMNDQLTDRCACTDCCGSCDCISMSGTAANEFAGLHAWN